MCKMMGVECERIAVENTFDEEKKFISRQLLSNKIKPYTGQRSYLDLTTDKGYYGTYTEDEYENIKKLRQDGELLKKLTEEPTEETQEQKEEQTEEKTTE